MNTEALAEPIAGRPAGTGRPALHDAAPRRADGRRDAAPVDDRHGAGAAPAYGHLVSSGVDTSHGAILYLEDVTVSFDGFRALNALSLTLDDGELRCIIGPNGAGKTTMMDAVTGRIRPDSGRIFYGQTIDLTRLAEAQIVAAGIGRKFQRPTVFETMSVFDNMELALENDKRGWASLRAKLDSAQIGRIESILETINLRAEVDRIAGTLSHGQKQWLEIGMLLAQRPRLILLDEPVAGMTDAETEKTAELCLQLAGEHTVVVVEHDMEFVAKIARTVTVLHEGSVLAEGSMDAVRGDPRVIEVYLGR
ncbi:MAG: urea ABC transporter ATP-binding protein UrtD [Limnobacter sp.]|nr:urea ABC transporter ATP-binding protein UrtD [Limnobacter sp.]